MWTRPCLARCYHFWIRNKLWANFHKWKGNTEPEPQRDFVKKGFINGWISRVLSLDEAQLRLPLTAFDIGIQILSVFSAACFSSFPPSMWPSAWFPYWIRNFLSEKREKKKRKTEAEVVYESQQQMISVFDEQMETIILHSSENHTKYKTMFLNTGDIFWHFIPFYFIYFFYFLEIFEKSSWHPRLLWKKESQKHEDNIPEAETFYTTHSVIFGLRKTRHDWAVTFSCAAKGKRSEARFFFFFLNMYRPFDATQGQLLPTSSEIFQTLVSEMCFCAEITFLAQSRISVTKKRHWEGF